MPKVFQSAIRLLAQREHGAFELAEKLMHKGYNQTETLEAIAKCQCLALQSDRRFAEMLSRSRIQQGYGPLRIAQELQAKRIDSELIHEVLAQEEDNWLSYAQAVRQKKFKENKVLSRPETQKQWRFLQYRGFSTDTITHLFKQDLNVVK